MRNCVEPRLALSSFVEIDQVRNGDDIGAIDDAVFLFLSFKPWRGEIIPAQLGVEAVPNHEVAIVQSPTSFEAPLQNFLVGSALQHALPKIDIIHPQKIAAGAVGSFGRAEVGMIICVGAWSFL